MGKFADFFGGSGGANLGFSSSKTKTNSNSSGSGATNADITRFDTASKQQLDDLVKLLQGNVAAPNTEFNKSSAIGDVAGVVQNLFRQFKDQTLPQIFTQQAGTGGYNSTSAQFLANDAFAETTSKAAAVTMDTIGKYEDLSRNRLSVNLEGMINALNLEAQATESQKSTESFNSTSRSTSKSKGFGFNL